MSQPEWKFVKQLGDVNPIDHDGLFLFVDETGVYPPELEVLTKLEGDTETEFNEHGEVTEHGDERWEVHRFTLEPCTYGMENPDTGQWEPLNRLDSQGVLSDNKFHPNTPAWFAKPESEKANRPQDTTYLSDICRTNDCDQWELIQQFCSDDPVQRAMAWREVMLYHGVHELDQYPLTFDCEEEADARQQLEKRYADCNEGGTA